MRALRSVAPLAFLVAAVLGGAPALAEDDWKAPDSAVKKKNPIPVNDQTMAQAKKVYEKECLSCHGAKGKGDGPAAEALEKPPRNLSVSTKGQTDGGIFWKISEGRKPMPTFSKTLGVDDRWAVIHYVRTLAGDKPGADSAGGGGGEAKPVAPELAAPDGHKAAISAVLQSALKATAALAKDDAAAAAAEASALVDAVAKLPKSDGLDDAGKKAWDEGRAALEKAAAAFKPSKELAAQRAAFKDVAAALAGLVGKFGHAEAAPVGIWSSEAGSWLGSDASPFEKGKAGKLEKSVAPK